MSHVSRRSVLVGSAVVGGAAVAGMGGATPARAASNRLGPAATVTPGDPRYPDLISGSNRRWAGNPQAIRVAVTTEQVVDAVEDAVRAGKRIAVRSGGHCYEDFVYNPQVQIVIDLSAMNSVHYDEAHRAFVVEPGATLWEAYQELYRAFGVTIPAGSCSSVGAGGHICGGGYGLLSRQFGTSVDHLYAVEVVVVDRRGKARAIIATRDRNDPHRDLWWAHTGGGGGSFGIVTRYFLRTPGTERLAPSEQLPKPPAEVYVHSLSWRWPDIDESNFHTLLRNYGTFYEHHSAPDSPYSGMYSKLAINTAISGSISLVTKMDATIPGAAGLLEDYINALNAGLVEPQPMTERAGEIQALPEFFVPTATSWLTAMRSLNGTSFGRYGDYKSAYMRRGFPDEQIAAIYRHLTGSPYRGDLLQIDSYGGRINAVAPGETAIAQRDSVLKLQYQAYWSNAAEEAGKVAWLRAFYRDVYASTGGVPVPNGVTDGCYVNYPDTDIGDPTWNTSGVPWHDLYWKQGYAKLQRVKKEYDPGNVFRHTQSVRLPGAS